MEITHENPADGATDAKVRERIIMAYRNYVLEKGTNPASIYSFCKDIEIEEAQFYEHFNRFEQVSEAFGPTCFPRL
ncbi:MAG: hypothetical protein U5L96_21530 [Owenweeksia sp.]|nr:hypothetical protein [Owenweeksia sp.]